MRSVGDGDYSRPSSDEVKSGFGYTRISAFFIPLWCAREQFYVFSLIVYLLTLSGFSPLNIYLRLVSHKIKNLLLKC